MNPQINKTKSPWSLILLTLLVVGLASCAQAESPETASPSPTRALTPYWTATPDIPTPSPSPDQVVFSPTPPPPPTSTPFTYNVIEDDTLLAIASRHGVNLEELLAANPGVDPNFLTIGMTLTIPILESNDSALPTPTPVPLSLSPPRCYPTEDNGLWCISLARNDSGIDLESVSARITLNAADVEAPQIQVAIPPLNILPSGEELPLVAFFSPPAPKDVQPHIQLLTALPIAQREERYKQVDQSIGEVIISDRGISATVRGEISIPIEDDRPDTVWLTGVAYTSSEEVAGFRKWEADIPSDPGERTPFEITIFSLGPQIQRVEVYVEAR
jgi:LysM repeat protein